MAGTSELLAAALSYAARGWRVFPLHTPTGEEERPCSCGTKGCTSVGKHPRIMNWQQQATTDPAQIAKWWEMWPAANVGIACGEASNLWALDIDGREGMETLRQEKAAGHLLPISPRSVTGSGGRHVLFSFAPGLPNRVRFAPGMDVRSEGGLIVAPPSLHESGVYYAWDKKADPETVPLAPAPEWLLDKIRQASRTRTTTEFEGEIREGERNRRLFENGASMRRRGMSETAICAALLVENQERVKPPLDEPEVREIARKAARYEPNLGAAGTNGTHATNGARPADGVLSGVTAAALVQKQFKPLFSPIPGLAVEGLNLLAGGTKTAKSWMAIAWAISVAAGGRAFGQIQTNPCGVLYLALEDSERRLKERLLQLLDGAPAPPGLHFYTEWPRMDKGGLVQLKEWLTAHPDVRFVVVDVLQKLRAARKAGVDPYQQDYDELAAFKGVADQFELALLCLHHTRKMTAPDPFDLVAGSVAMTGAPDSLMVLMRQRDSIEATFHITGREVEMQSLALQWDERTATWILLGDAASHRLSEERQDILRALRLAPGPVSPREMAILLEKPEGPVKKLMWQMANEGELTRPSYGKYGLSMFNASNSSNSTPSGNSGNSGNSSSRFGREDN